MKRYALIGTILAVAFAITTVHAQSMYVSEIIEITLRTGPGIDHKVIAMVRSGQPLEVLETGQEWTKVRLPNEREGYMLSRFLTEKKPNAMLLDNLQENYRALESKLNNNLEDSQAKQDENQKLLSDLAAKENQLDALTKLYNSLKAESAEFLNLKTNHKKSVAQLKDQSRKALEFEEAYTKLQKRQIFRWVLTGAGILLVGVLIGMTSRRQRKRSSLL